MITIHSSDSNQWNAMVIKTAHSDSSYDSLVREVTSCSHYSQLQPGGLYTSSMKVCFLGATWGGEPGVSTCVWELHAAYDRLRLPVHVHEGCVHMFMSSAQEPLHHLQALLGVNWAADRHRSQ